MKDKAIVIGQEQNKTKVKILAAQLCHKCQARIFCLGNKITEDVILVHNPLGARSGDEVEIEIPEMEYTKLMIKIFSVLLVGIISGAAIGYVLSTLFHFAQEVAILSATLFALAGSLFLAQRTLQKYNSLFPIITRVIKKGEDNG